MTQKKRRLKDAATDQSAKRRVRVRKKKNHALLKIAAALVIGFAGGVGFARVIRFL